MKVLVLADLHFDMWRPRGLDPLVHVADHLGDLAAVILAGDVAHRPIHRWPDAFAYVRSKTGGVPIHIFPGNHDFYEYDLDREDEMAACALAHGVDYAQKRVLVFGDTRILCCTLWTDFRLGGEFQDNKRRVSQHLNDFKLIGISKEASYRKVWARDFIRLHEDHRAWLESKLAEPWEGRTIVVTHHAPHPSVMKPYDLDLSAGFGSDMSDLMIGAGAPDLWLYGHTHDLGDGRVGNTEIKAVCLGCPDDLREEDIKARIDRMLIEV